MDCSKCLDKCHAACCGLVPFTPEFIKQNPPIRKIEATLEVGNGYVVLETGDHTCPYLNEDYSCSIYDKRPEVCGLYGNESQINLTCQFQASDGRIRGRQERRQIERKINKFIQAFVKRNK